MYGNYNMGAGYAVYLPADQAEAAVQAALDCGLEAWAAGTVEQGPQQVVIKPKNITFEGDSLGVR
jgi:phosphoribosylformylglycinamidine cyclo-ligase